MVMWEKSRCSILFHFDVPGRQVTDGDQQSRLSGKLGELEFPGPGAVAVGAACVGSDEQSCRLGVGVLALAVPPAADRFHGERGGVVVGSDVDPAGVRPEVVDRAGGAPLSVIKEYIEQQKRPL
jgi:hypothetical protein